MLTAFQRSDQREDCSERVFADQHASSDESTIKPIASSATTSPSSSPQQQTPAVRSNIMDRRRKKMRIMSDEEKQDTDGTSAPTISVPLKKRFARDFTNGSDDKNTPIVMIKTEPNETKEQREEQVRGGIDHTKDDKDTPSPTKIITTRPPLMTSPHKVVEKKMIQKPTNKVTTQREKGTTPIEKGTTQMEKGTIQREKGKGREEKKTIVQEKRKVGRPKGSKNKKNGVREEKKTETLPKPRKRKNESKETQPTKRSSASGKSESSSDSLSDSSSDSSSTSSSSSDSETSSIEDTKPRSSHQKTPRERKGSHVVNRTTKQIEKKVEEKKAEEKKAEEKKKEEKKEEKKKEEKKVEEKKVEEKKVEEKKVEEKKEERKSYKILSSDKPFSKPKRENLSEDGGYTSEDSLDEPNDWDCEGDYRRFVWMELPRLPSDHSSASSDDDSSSDDSSSDSSSSSGTSSSSSGSSTSSSSEEEQKEKPAVVPVKRGRGRPRTVRRVEEKTQVKKEEREEEREQEEREQEERPARRGPGRPARRGPGRPARREKTEQKTEQETKEKRKYSKRSSIQEEAAKFLSQGAHKRNTRERKTVSSMLAGVVDQEQMLSKAIDYTKKADMEREQQLKLQALLQREVEQEKKFEETRQIMHRIETEKDEERLAGTFVPKRQCYVDGDLKEDYTLTLANRRLLLDSIEKYAEEMARTIHQRRTEMKGLLHSSSAVVM
ncbi:hypothetical protein PROFUN_06726 [Planoprotostelium fungivorum]|uniref:Uncharacterized protein n=1 Tax=Planoprotostelium fungivorum TaxID=1890364 RepID=A0A2P6NG81_9EUKA|nr:hypothetical protein PROFUN_06726 [Planoprotostelium fungivorum]